MSIRLVGEKELRDAIARSEQGGKSKKHALECLAALRELLDDFKPFIPVDLERDPYFDTGYGIELIEEIESDISDWPDPVTIDSLREEGLA